MIDHKTRRLVDLLRLSAYLLYKNSLYVGPKCTETTFEELYNPKVGDLVMEITTYGMRNPIEGIGRLMKIESEPIYKTKEEQIKDGWLENENPTQIVYTLSLIFDDNREYRWTNCKFIKVKEILNEDVDAYYKTFGSNLKK